MDTDRAYLFGLIIGGGDFGNAEDVFRIKLPYKQWGSYLSNPKRSSDISRDILGFVGPLIKSIYALNVSYEATARGIWSILCEGDLTELVDDLNKYGVKCEGDLRQNVSINQIVPDLLDDNLKRRFIAGLADTIGSTSPSHRRFTNEIQILSFELKGFNFSFVCELCRLLYSVGCLPDQILWNHPNFHSANDPHYKQWNKGFKLRIQIDQYMQFGAFAFKTKAESALENQKQQEYSHEAIPCPEKEMKASISCVHPAELDDRLPDVIKGGHYLHNRHVCAVLGCQHAPYDKIANLLTKAGELINPFPILCKDSSENIRQIIQSNGLYAKRQYIISSVKIKQLVEKFKENNKVLIYGDGKGKGYPLTEVLKAVAYIIAEESDLRGKRPKGNYINLIELYLRTNPNLCVEIHKPDLLTPLVVFANNKGALIGAHNPTVYQKLISVSQDCKYKVLVRQITEEDLQDAE